MKIYRVWYGWPLILIKEFYKFLQRIKPIKWFLQPPNIYAYCRRCGRRLHDFWVPDEVWLAVTENPNTVYCYDCFCYISDKKGIGQRMDAAGHYYNPSLPPAKMKAR